MKQKPQRLNEAEIGSALAEIGGWTVQNGKLHREYRFASFVEAFGFMASGALIAEAMNHHPEWFNVYHTVRIDLVTHDVQGISQNDLEMARRFEQLARVRLQGGSA